MNIALKAKYSFYSTLVFFIIANPETYKIVQRILGSVIGTVANGGCPTTLGLMFHTALFFFVMLALMMFPRN